MQQKEHLLWSRNAAELSCSAAATREPVAVWVSLLVAPLKGAGAL